MKSASNPSNPAAAPAAKAKGKPSPRTKAIAAAAPSTEARATANSEKGPPETPASGKPPSLGAATSAAADGEVDEAELARIAAVEKKIAAPRGPKPDKRPRQATAAASSKTSNVVAPSGETPAVAGVVSNGVSTGADVTPKAREELDPSNAQRSSDESPPKALDSVAGVDTGVAVDTGTAADLAMAATKVQSVYRGNQARRRTKDLADEKRSSATMADVTDQQITSEPGAKTDDKSSTPAVAGDQAVGAEDSAGKSIAVGQPSAADAVKHSGPASMGEEGTLKEAEASELGKQLNGLPKQHGILKQPEAVGQPSAEEVQSKDPGEEPVKAEAPAKAKKLWGNLRGVVGMVDAVQRKSSKEGEAPAPPPENAITKQLAEARQAIKKRRRRRNAKFDRKRRQMLMRLRKIWFETKAVELRTAILNQVNMKIGDVKGQKQVQQCFKVLDTKKAYVVLKEGFFEQLNDLSVEWEDTEVERFWKMLAGGERLSFQAFSAIFRVKVDPDKLRRDQEEAMAAIDQMEKNGPRQGVMHGGGNRFGRKMSVDGREMYSGDDRRGGAAFTMGDKSRRKTGTDGREYDPNDGHEARSTKFGKDRQPAAKRRTVAPKKAANPPNPVRRTEALLRHADAVAENPEATVEEADGESEEEEEDDEEVLAYAAFLKICDSAEAASIVVRLQARYRGLMTRRRLKREREFRAAVRIQCAFRKYWARKYFRFLRVVLSYHRSVPWRRPKRRKQSKSLPGVGLPGILGARKLSKQYMERLRSKEIVSRNPSRFQSKEVGEDRRVPSRFQSQEGGEDRRVSKSEARFRSQDGSRVSEDRGKSGQRGIPPDSASRAKSKEAVVRLPPVDLIIVA